MAEKASLVRRQPKLDSTVQNYRRILVGYDGSKNAARALARAARLAAPLGASLRVVVAVDTVLPTFGPTPGYYPESYVDSMFEDAKASLATAVQLCKEVSEDVTGSVEEGHPAEAILKVARGEGADLIVVGRRGMSGVERFLTGSVSSSIVNHLSCDVLVVR